jgi:hypothetical protein
MQIGNASSFQKPFIQDTYAGICRVISDIGLFSTSEIPDGTLDQVTSLGVKESVVCSRSVSEVPAILFIIRPQMILISHLVLDFY